MSNPIVIAYHLIWTAYGWWLPNDIRGSGSTAIRNDVLKQLGELHFGRKRSQPAGWQVRDFYQQAAELLKYPLLTFQADQVNAIASAFQGVIQQMKYTCYACAIMPDHIHLLIRKHKHLAEEMMANFQAAGRATIAGTGQWEQKHPVFTLGGWKVYLDHPEEVWRTIPYIEENPDKIGLARQQWGFVTPYNNWPLHEGHSPNSPYARRLRE
jgi:REP-associated tyrosine transposase